MYFSKEDIKDPLSITELEVRTKLNIKGTGITINSLLVKLKIILLKNKEKDS